MLDLIDVDLFAGGGGVSEGLRLTTGRGPHIAINHSADALACHAVNHPETEHYISDVYAVDPVTACRGRAIRLLWLSPDCKHHSKAKGGKPLDKNIRDLAWVAFRWIDLLPPHQRPLVIGLENVPEFRDWGPLDENNKPIPERRGETFALFVDRLKAAGYVVDWRIDICADFGPPTIRKRLILQARRDGHPIMWAQPSYAKAGANGRRPWKPAADIIDWSLPCPSIFLTREDGRAIGVKRPLAEQTLARIARGVQRYVLDAADPFLVPITHTGDLRAHSVREPLRTVTAANRGEHALVVPHLMTMRNSGKPFSAMDEPTHTVTAGGAHINLVSAFLAQHNTGVVGRETRAPLSTITQRGTQQTVVSAHLLNLKGSDRRASDARAPSPAVCAQGGHLAAVHAFMIKYYGAGTGQDMFEPAHTVTTKERFGLVMVHGEPYQIVDIGMRMLTPRELFRAQSFPDSYIIDRRPDGSRLNKTVQISHAGNSVPPVWVAEHFRAMLAPYLSGFAMAA